MAFYMSPIVDVNEIDLSTTIPAVATSIGVIILRNTYKGPERKKMLITSVNELISTFGKPTNVTGTYQNYQDILAATGYLRYGNALYATRTMPVSATFAGTVGISGADVSFSAYSTATAYKLSDFDSEDPDEFGVEFPPSLPYAFNVIASSRGAWGNNVRVAVCDYNTYSSIASGGTGCGTGDAHTDIDAIDSPLLDTKDFLVIVSVRDQGDAAESGGTADNDSSYKVKEYWNVSTMEDRYDDQGRRTFCETLINSSSQYIRFSLSDSLKNEVFTCSTSGYQVFGGGANYDSTNAADTTTDALIMADLDLYANPEEIDVNIFIDSNNSATVKEYIDTICQSRKDCIAILDCLDTHVINNRGEEATDLRTWRRDTLNLNSSYSSLYGNWLEVYDKWNGKYRWIAPSGHVAGIYVNTDDVSDPWFAPAGLNRALLSNVRRLAWNPTLGQRDILYKAGVNPIVSFSGQGKVLWGQKTLLDKESAFNRINVRRLFIVLEKAISTAAKYFLFEPNDDLTRLLLINMIDPFLRDVRSRRGIYDYMVVCNESNNTPERVDRNELWCDIYIKPTRAAEFIVLNFIATKTGASFTELASA
jgi:hypothetical protein